MKKISYIAALVIAMMAVSCVQDMNDDAPQAGTKTFEASFDATASKAILRPGADESKVEWVKGDQVSVLVGDSKFIYEAQSDGLTTTLSTSSSDVPSEGTFYGLYPYDADAVLTSGVITTALPSEQTAVLGSFSTHLAVAQEVSGMMAFRNVCGLVKINVSSDNVTKVVFEGNSGEIVAGAIDVTVSDTPSWVAVADQGSESVSLLPASGASVIAAGDYYFAVLPQTFAAGFKVTAYKGETASVIRNVATEIVVERSGMIAGKSFGINGSGTEDDPYVLKTAQDMVDMRSLAKLGGETWFKMANDINMEGVTNYVPVNFDGNFERKIHFDGGNYTISNFYYDKAVNGANYGSLFGVLYGSCKNLKVDNATIKATNGCGVIGGYVGTTNKPAVVENVTVTNSSVTNSGDRCGGICGTAKEATFKNVSFQGKVISTKTGEAKSGGFVGQTETKAVFVDCVADVIFEGAGTDLGGFVGKILGENEFTGCDVTVGMTSGVASKNRCGGFLGWNSSAKTTFTDCHVLNGSTITNKTNRTSVSNGNFGGFIGFGDTNNSVTTIIDCSADVVMDVDANSTYNGGFIGGTGYTSTTTIKGCSAAGVVNGNNYVGGFFGAVMSTVVIEQCSCSTDVTSTGQRSGNFVGTATKSLTIRDCYSTGDITASGQQVGGILGYTGAVASIIERCYATGDVISNTAGTGGILGTNQVAGTKVDKCIAWNANIICNRASADKWAPGAVVGASDKSVTLTDCFRRADMSFYDKAGAMTLSDHENVSDATPPTPDYLDNLTQAAYHGKAAAADATISSVAKSLGWPEDIWDLSGEAPTLK